MEAATVQAADEAFARCARWSEEESKGAAALDCPAAVKKGLEAFRAYPNNPRLCAILVQLGDHLGKTYGADALTADPAMVGRLCEGSLPHFKELYKANKVPNPYFQSLCPKQAAQAY